jgi:putative phosphoserine phosphatase / 1-acylglycerol-3-phosphate O-acyltransferase
VPFARPELMPYVRFDIAGLEHIPDEGPAIIVGNHRSYFDPIAVAFAVAKRGRPVRFLGKKEVFDAPLVGQLAKALGGIRVERGPGPTSPSSGRGRACGGRAGGHPPPGHHPSRAGLLRPGAEGAVGCRPARAMSGAPVIPLGLWGTEQVWPRSARVPNVLNLTSPPTVRIRVGSRSRSGRRRRGRHRAR